MMIGLLVTMEEACGVCEELRKESFGGLSDKRDEDENKNGSRTRGFHHCAGTSDSSFLVRGQLWSSAKKGSLVCCKAVVGDEVWEMDFVLRINVIRKIVVWLWLLGLSMKFWILLIILASVAEVDKLLVKDDFTDLL